MPETTVSIDSVVLRVMQSSAGRAAGQRGELVAHRGFVRHLRRAQVVRRLVVDLADLGDERLEHRRGLHAVVAALEVDVVGLEPVLGANRGPERVVLGELLRRELGDSRPERVAEQQAESRPAADVRRNSRLFMEHDTLRSPHMRRFGVLASIAIVIGSLGLGPASADQGLDQMLSAYAAGDHAAVARTFARSVDFQKNRLSDQPPARAVARRVVADESGSAHRARQSIVDHRAGVHARAPRRQASDMSWHARRRRGRRPRMTRSNGAGTSSPSECSNDGSSAPRSCATSTRCRRRARSGRERVRVGSPDSVRARRRAGTALPADARDGPARSRPGRVRRRVRDAGGRASAPRSNACRSRCRIFEAAARNAETREEAQTRAGFAFFQLGRNADAREVARRRDAAAPIARSRTGTRCSAAVSRMRSASRSTPSAPIATRSRLFPNAHSASIGLALALFRLQRDDDAERRCGSVRRQSLNAVDPWENVLRSRRPLRGPTGSPSCEERRVQ